MFTFLAPPVRHDLTCLCRSHANDPSFIVMFSGGISYLSYARYMFCPSPQALDQLERIKRRVRIMKVIIL
jgi:hypothetical protein